VVVKLLSFYQLELTDRVAERTAELVEAQRQADTAREHAQRMEAVGQLAGGVAHDFNNLLAVVLGRLRMIDEELTDHPELRDWVRSSIRAAERGTTLTKSLLAFSRQQALLPIVLDLNLAVDEIEDMLRRVLGEAYDIRAIKAPDLWSVEVDPGQLQNAMINLVINARDAMPDGGTVSVSTSNAVLDTAHTRGRSDLTPGSYVLLSVSDTGIGMPPEVVERAFEPFFTTKDVGKGTGLGLSMVYGFVKQTGGLVTIDSEPGKGTTVRVYLPRHVERAAPSESAGAVRAPRGTETILVVEDNHELRKVIRLQLERLGYSVVEAAHGADGLRALRDHPRIDVLLTDVVMPQGISGPELAERAGASRPDIKVIFMSAYDEKHNVLEGAVRLLRKPFHPDELANEIRAALGGGG
jgi:signal transduction histidine kinase